MWLAVLVAARCAGPASGPPVLTADVPLHLEDHLDAATIEGSEVAADPPKPVEWRFDEPQPDWKATPLWNPPYGAPVLAQIGEALRVTLTDRVRVQAPQGSLRGAIHVDLPEWEGRDWADVVIRARANSASSVDMVGLGFNLREGRGTATTRPTAPFQFGGQESPIVRDGTIQTYRLQVNRDAQAFKGPWRQLMLYFGSDGEPGSIDLLSVSVVARGLHDKTMAHQDYQVGRFIERLKATGEWDHTLLIVAADHGHIAGGAHFGVGLADPLPPPWEIAMASSYHTRVPLVIVLPGRIRGGPWFDDPVSMIDVLPTILDLVGLPMPAIMQGQSLAPLLLGREGWTPRPVILDEFEVDRDTGQLLGAIEVIDGRWAASLFIEPRPKEGRIPFRSHHHEGPGKTAVWKARKQTVPRLLLYDLWSDARAFHSVHEAHPNLVEKYTTFLQAQFKAHQALAQQLTPSEALPLTPEQLRTLRSLGYIR